MTLWAKRVGLVLAVAFLILTFINASWLAPAPRGYPRLIAQGGLGQQPAVPDAPGCRAAQIEPPLHFTIGNTLPALHEARRLGAQMIQIDLRLTADVRIVLFQDDDLSCQTDGKGAIEAKTLAELKALDAGYGFTADGGRTFPLRGKGTGQIATVEEAMAIVPESALLFTLHGRNSALAERLVTALRAAGRDPASRHDGFEADGPTLAPIRAAFPRAWIMSEAETAGCSSAYALWGWFGVVPQACKGGTLVVPLNRQWLVPGWPNRTLARMTQAQANVVVTGPGKDSRGIDLPEQLGDIPMGYNGYIRVADIYAVGPALRPTFNKRNPVEEADLARTLDARRKARD